MTKREKANPNAAAVYLPPDLKDKLMRRATATGRSVSSLIVEAIRFRFARLEELGEAAAGARITRLERRLAVARSDVGVIKECLFVFVRVWLEHNPPIDPEHEDSAARSAAARFERFLDLVASALNTGRSIAPLDAPSPFDDAQAGEPGPDQAGAVASGEAQTKQGSIESDHDPAATGEEEERP